MKDIGSDFACWMNRPLARVQVYSYKVAMRIFGETIPLRYTCKAHYRDRQINDMRKTVAGAIRIARKGKVKLPHYNEGTGNYEWEMTRTQGK